MFENARLPCPLGHRARRDVRSRGQRGGGEARVAEAFEGDAGVRGERGVVRRGDEVERAPEVFAGKAGLVAGLGDFRGAEAAHAGGEEGFVRGIEGEAARKPCGRDEAEDFGGFVLRVEIHDGDGVLRGVGDVENFPAGIESERARLRAKGIGGCGASPDFFHKLSARGGDDGERVAAGIGRDDIVAVRRNGECTAVQAGLDFSEHFIRGEVDDDHRARARD